MRRVLLLLPMDIEAGRGMARGIRDYARGRENWVFQIVFPHFPVARFLAQAHVDGVIAHLNLKSLVAPVLKLGKPVVNVSNAIGDELGLPRVGSDEDRIGRLAADHFLERGFQSFAFFGYGEITHSLQRGAAFRARLAERGYECHLFSGRAHRWRPATTLAFAVDARVRPWLRALPKPVAVFAPSAVRGFELLEICRQERLAVPQEVAVLAVDNDEVICDLASPPLSVVRTAWDQVGYEAASLLARLMAGKPPPAAPILIPPGDVVTRQSTDVLAIHDGALEKALRLIRERLDEPLRVGAVAAHAGVSRRMLERKFRTVVGQSPHQEIRRQRIERAQRLLAETNLVIEDIAARCGFATPPMFADVFRRVTGQSPSQYRRKHSRPPGLRI